MALNREANERLGGDEAILHFAGGCDSGLRFDLAMASEFEDRRGEDKQPSKVRSRIRLVEVNSEGYLRVFGWVSFCPLAANVCVIFKIEEVRPLFFCAGRVQHLIQTPVHRQHQECEEYLVEA